MSVKNCEKLEKSMVALTVEVGAADFEAAVEKAYKKQRGQIRVPGFRPGKAPRKMIEAMFGAQVFYEEAVNIALPDAYEEAVKEQDLQVVGYPQVELLDVGKEGFSFKATVAVFPEMTLGQYKGLEAPRPRQRSPMRMWTPGSRRWLSATAAWSAWTGRWRRATLPTSISRASWTASPLTAARARTTTWRSASGSFVPGFEDQLIGMKAEEERDINITFPEDYHADLAGKAVVFHVKVNAVKVKEVPAIDDEFAKDVSEFDTLDELKADVRGKITAEREEAAGRAFEDILMGKVADGLTGEIPDAMVEAQAQRFVDNLPHADPVPGPAL